MKVWFLSDKLKASAAKIREMQKDIASHTPSVMLSMDKNLEEKQCAEEYGALASILSMAAFKLESVAQHADSIQPMKTDKFFKFDEQGNPIEISRDEFTTSFAPLLEDATEMVVTSEEV